MFKLIKRVLGFKAKVLPKGGDKVIVDSRKRIVDFIDKELKQLKIDLVKRLEEK